MIKNICCYIGTLGAGGIESCTLSQFLNLPKDSNSRFTFLLDYLPQNQSYVSTIESNGGHIISLFDAEYGTKYKFYKIRKIYRLLHVIRKNKFTSVHYHISTPTTLVYSALTKLLSKTAVYISSHAQGANTTSKFASYYYSICRNFFAKLSDYRYADSSKAGEWMFGKNPFDVVLNGISLDKFRFNKTVRDEIRAQLKVDEECFLLGHVGRFEYDKNHTFIIDVFSEYKKNNPHSKLLLIGNGSLHFQIENTCKDKGVFEDVIFIKNSNEVYKYLWAMDVFLFPSHKEGFGLVAVEAQAASLPVIASNKVPFETNQTDVISYLPIGSSNIVEWIEKLGEVSGFKSLRTDVNLNILYDNCDIKKVSEFLYKNYK